MPLQTLMDVQCRIVSHAQVGAQLWDMRLKPEMSLTTRQPVTELSCKPGQFVMIGLPCADGSPSFSFRRPMSVYRSHADGSISIFYKVHGRGTRLMSEMVVGQALAVLGPLGNCWPESLNPATTLLIGGGIGVAPLVCWTLSQQTLPEASPRLLYGVRSQSDTGLDEATCGLYGANRYHVCTDDGSDGFHGNVVQALQANPELLSDVESVFVCGPMPMMRAVVEYLAEAAASVTVWVSLEEHMPCGTGSCSGCVVSVKDEPLPVKTCQAGPVFNAQQLVWELPAV